MIVLDASAAVDLLVEPAAQTEATLLTRDVRLGRTTGHRARAEVV
jgi:predicted nucleic acid-binding protein